MKLKLRCIYIRMYCLESRNGVVEDGMAIGKEATPFADQSNQAFSTSQHFHSQQDNNKMMMMMNGVVSGLLCHQHPTIAIFYKGCKEEEREREGAEEFHEWNERKPSNLPPTTLYIFAPNFFDKKSIGNF